MRSLRTTMHPGVMPPDLRVRTRRQRGPHLMAGDLDGACGPLAMWTALMVLGIATRPQVMCQRFMFTDDAFEDTWLRSLDVWFSGADDNEMDALLDTVLRYVERDTCAGAMRSQVEFTVRHLRIGDVVLLGLERPGVAAGHWLVAVGIEELVADARTDVIGILCLDSSVPAPGLHRYNARLDLHVPHKGATFVRLHRANGDVRSMQIERAISLTRKPWPTAATARVGGRT